MITIKNATSPSGKMIDHKIESERDLVIDASGLLLLPGVIDAHVHFRTPGHEHKENWESGACAALAGGITTVFDMPNTTPACTSRTRLEEKHTLIHKQLEHAGIPIRFGLYLGADRDHLGEIELCQNIAIGLKIFMGSSTGGLLMEDTDSLSRAFACAAKADMLVAVHAEDEEMIRAKGVGHIPEAHSDIRSPDVAAAAVEQAIGLAQEHGARLHILHVSSAPELGLIRAAKARGVQVTAEATPHHLFLDTTAYQAWGTLAQVNPPLRSPDDRAALWEAVRDGTIDTVGSDHAPHLLNEKNRPYPEAPSGIPGVETTLPLLLTAVEHGLLSLQRVIELTSQAVSRIYRLDPTSDVVLVNLKTRRPVDEATLNTRCGWSPFRGRVLCGWPSYVIVSRKAFRIHHGHPEPLQAALRH